MTIGTIDESQRKAARVVGFAYLFALPPAIFAEFYVRTQLIAFDSAAQTARNIMAHERLFRLGTASNLTVFAVDVVLVLAGLRSTAFCYLWFKSRFIPRALAAWGMVASFLMGACAFSFIIFPELAKVIPVEIYGAPIFFFELTMGFWLLLKGLPPSGAAPDRVSGSAQAGAI